jgi:hypothetical protein
MSVMNAVALLPLHLGALHGYEKALTLVLAFGPFLLLGLVIVLRRRHDARGRADATQQRDR